MATATMGKFHAQHRRGGVCAQQRAPDTQVGTLRSPAVAKRKKCVLPWRSPHIVCMACQRHLLVTFSRGKTDCILPWKCDSYRG